MIPLILTFTIMKILTLKLSCWIIFATQLARLLDLQCHATSLFPGFSLIFFLINAHRYVPCPRGDNEFPIPFTSLEYLWFNLFKLYGAAWRHWSSPLHQTTTGRISSLTHKKSLIIKRIFRVFWPSPCKKKRKKKGWSLESGLTN